MRIATIRVRRDVGSALAEMRVGLITAWQTGEYQGEVFEFESPTAFFKLLTLKRWELLERLQVEGPVEVQALARSLRRDVRRVHDDVQPLLEVGLIERDEEGHLFVPFGEIRADFTLRGAAA